MTFKQAMAELKALGSEQTRKTFIRHGAHPDKLLGVKYGDLEKLAKKIKTDHPLALKLWESGIHDARVLATRAADVEQLSASLLDSWSKGLRDRILVCDLSDLVARSKLAARTGAKWRKSKQEFIACAGWAIIGAQCVQKGAELDTSDLEDLLKEIESNIATAKNMVRYSMNGALIAIGGYSPGLRRKATAAAKRIGKVEVDHGDTACKTPDAVPYIEKIWARKK